MKSIILSLLIFSSVITYAQSVENIDLCCESVDQQETASSGRFYGGDLWQSFTAGKNGFLTKVRAYHYNYAQSGTLYIYKGDVNSGSILHQQDYSASGTEFLYFPLTTPVQINQGETYFIRFTNFNWFVTANNAYPGGSASKNSSLDFIFQTYVSELTNNAEYTYEAISEKIGTWLGMDFSRLRYDHISVLTGLSDDELEAYEYFKAKYSEAVTEQVNKNGNLEGLPQNSRWRDFEYTWANDLEYSQVLENSNWISLLYENLSQQETQTIGGFLASENENALPAEFVHLTIAPNMDYDPSTPQSDNQTEDYAAYGLGKDNILYRSRDDLETWIALDNPMVGTEELEYKSNGVAAGKNGNIFALMKKKNLSESIENSYQLYISDDYGNSWEQSAIKAGLSKTRAEVKKAWDNHKDKEGKTFDEFWQAVIEQFSRSFTSIAVRDNGTLCLAVVQGKIPPTIQLSGSGGEKDDLLPFFNPMSAQSHKAGMEFGDIAIRSSRSRGTTIAIVLQSNASQPIWVFGASGPDHILDKVQTKFTQVEIGGTDGEVIFALTDNDEILFVMEDINTREFILRPIPTIDRNNAEEKTPWRSLIHAGLKAKTLASTKSGVWLTNEMDEPAIFVKFPRIVTPTATALKKVQEKLRKLNTERTAAIRLYHSINDFIDDLEIQAKNDRAWIRQAINIQGNEDQKFLPTQTLPEGPSAGVSVENAIQIMSNTFIGYIPGAGGILNGILNFAFLLMDTPNDQQEPENLQSELNPAYEARRFTLEAEVFEQNMTATFDHLRKSVRTFMKVAMRNPGTIKKLSDASAVFASENVDPENDQARQRYSQALSIARTELRRSAWKTLLPIKGFIAAEETSELDEWEKYQQGFDSNDRSVIAVSASTYAYYVPDSRFREGGWREAQYSYVWRIKTGTDESQSEIQTITNTPIDINDLTNLLNPSEIFDLLKHKKFRVGTKQYKVYKSGVRGRSATEITDRSEILKLSYTVERYIPFFSTEIKDEITWLEIDDIEKKQMSQNWTVEIRGGPHGSRIYYVYEFGYYPGVSEGRFIKRPSFTNLVKK